MIMSEETKVAIRAAAAEKKSACEAVRQVIASKTLEAFDLPEGFLTALKTAVGYRNASGSTGSSASRKSNGGVLDRIADYFTALEVGQSRDEMEVFSQFRMGRSEMTSIRRRLIVDLAPEDRVYIQFDSANESWVFVGEGAEVPADFEMPAFSDKVRERAGL